MTVSAVDERMTDRLSSLLRTESFGRSMRWFDSVGSTNTIAGMWAAGDAPDGALVGAEAQTEGRGRFDRKWTVEPGQNLTFSLILFPGLAADRLGMISIAFSVAVATSLRRTVGPGQVEIKWPNDILIGDRKVCGMLQESSFPVGGRKGRVVIGIGLNVNQIDFPPELQDKATSIRQATGHDTDRAELLADLLSEMEGVYRALHTGKDAILRARYEANLDSLGREVTFLRVGAGEPTTGIVTGIDARGGLVVVTPAGRETVFAGDVSFSRR